MPRVHSVKKARKEHTCINGHTINIGKPYYWAKPAWRPKKCKCKGCGSFRPSELTSSGHLATIYRVQEKLARLEVTDNNVGGICSDLEGFADEIEGVGEDYNESADNMEEYFRGSSQIEDIREKAGNCMEWAESLRDAKNGVEDLASGAEELLQEKDELQEEEHKILNDPDNKERFEAIQERLSVLKSEIQEKFDEVSARVDEASQESNF